MQAPRFAAPRPSVQSDVQQQPEPGSETKPNRQSAPGCTSRPADEQSGTSINSSQDVKSKLLKRQSMPAVPRKPLACVSNKVVSKTPSSNITLPHNANLPPDSADGDTLPNRKRKLVAAVAPRSLAARTINHDDDDFA